MRLDYTGHIARFLHLRRYIEKLIILFSSVLDTRLLLRTKFNRATVSKERSFKVHLGSKRVRQALSWHSGVTTDWLRAGKRLISRQNILVPHYCAYKMSIVWLFPC
jgi:hypothetical protein